MDPDPDYLIALARYELWEANRSGTPTEQARAQSHLTQLVAEATAAGRT